MKKLSIVVPSYNERDNIRTLVERLDKALEGIDHEILFVDDSTDDTPDIIEEVSKERPHVRLKHRTDEKGLATAVLLGFQLAEGDVLACMDADLQHPPETVVQMWDKWKNGAEVVEGIKSDRGRESLGYKLSAGLFYKIMSRLIRMDMSSSSDFKLLDRRVVDVLLALPERNTFFRALTFWAGFRTESVEYEVRERQFGKSKWSLWSLMKYAINNATSFSTLPLQLVTVFGVVSILGSVILFVQTLVRYFMGNSVEGFTTVILLILIIGGFIMLSLGIIGHYIARIYEEVKGRPKYIISQVTENVNGNVTGSWKK